jgi:hypothetical protein
MRPNKICPTALAPLGSDVFKQDHSRPPALAVQRSDRFGGLPGVRNLDRSGIHFGRRFDERLLTTHLSLRSDLSVQCPVMIGPNGRPKNSRRGKMPRHYIRRL